MKNTPHTPHESRWHLRMDAAMEAVLAWCQEKGFWVWTGRVIGVGLLGLWVYLIWGKSASDIAPAEGLVMEGGDVSGVAYGLIYFAPLVASAVFLAPSLVPWVVAPLHRFIDSVYMGSSSIEKPKLTYEVAEHMLKMKRYEDAAAEFERIASWHPQEARAWCDGIRAALAAGDNAWATRLYRRGLLRCPKAADQLRHAHHAASGAV